MKEVTIDYLIIAFLVVQVGYWIVSYVITTSFQNAIGDDQTNDLVFWFNSQRKAMNKMSYFSEQDPVTKKYYYKIRVAFYTALVVQSVIIWSTIEIAST